MRIVLKVSSSNEYCDGGSEFALVDLSQELAALALQRIAALREQKTLDPNIDAAHYWAYFAACYFSPYAGLAIDDEEGMSFAVGDMLDQLQIEEREVVHVPEIFQVPRVRSPPWSARKWSCAKLRSRSQPSRNMPASMSRQLKFQSPCSKPL